MKVESVAYAIVESVRTVHFLICVGTFRAQRSCGVMSFGQSQEEWLRTIVRVSEERQGTLGLVSAEGVCNLHRMAALVTSRKVPSNSSLPYSVQESIGLSYRTVYLFLPKGCSSFCPSPSY